ncbi:MAG TPA: HipA N-terminal domain-containing protein [Saprospiraceae bacterium]|nr:HipA N-terminal domain-containing protein [Saprospiraceae bacterium]
MRKAAVYRNGTLAGILAEKSRRHFIFSYDQQYFNDPNMPAISLTLPKTQMEYSSEFLFPFFFNMLSEGHNKKLQCYHLRIDEDDHFGLLMAIARWDTIGAVTVKAI